MQRLNQEKLTELLRQRTADDMAAGRIGGTGLCVMQGGKEIYKEYKDEGLDGKQGAE